ncbi:hypothetical protein GCM10022291_30970 [Postechiella marina]|uniref:Antibiotic biosynthesis monooxygenase n=1 Tax=Postechiella marina TaxID=943941 RepID=A0ABP8CG52_9FLAO
MKVSKEGAYVSLKTNQGSADELRNFLIASAPVVKETEPDTLLWIALQLEENTFAIFDTYTNIEGKNAHFQGKVAGELAEKAPTLIAGGWNNGVLKNVIHPKILGAKVDTKHTNKVKKALVIKFTSSKGKQEEVVDFLINSANIVEETESETLFWYGLRIDDNTFATIVLFSDQYGIDLHMSGQVARKLQEKAPDWIEGDWEKGIIEHINIFDVIAIISQ